MARKPGRGKHVVWENGKLHLRLRRRSASFLCFVLGVVFMGGALYFWIFAPPLDFFLYDLFLGVCFASGLVVMGCAFFHIFRVVDLRVDPETKTIVRILRHPLGSRQASYRFEDAGTVTVFDTHTSSTDGDSPGAERTIDRFHVLLNLRSGERVTCAYFQHDDEADAVDFAARLGLMLGLTRPVVVTRMDDA